MLWCSTRTFLSICLTFFCAARFLRQTHGRPVSAHPFLYWEKTTTGEWELKRNTSLPKTTHEMSFLQLGGPITAVQGEPPDHAVCTCRLDATSGLRSQPVDNLLVASQGVSSPAFRQRSGKHV